MSVLSPKRFYGKAKAFIEPQLHWQVPQETGVYANDPRWSNKGNLYPYFTTLQKTDFF
jgi:hypothetical protein